MTKCPKCHREWTDGCEQHQSILIFDECIVCRFGPGGSGRAEDLEKISAARDEKEGL